MDQTTHMMGHSNSKRRARSPHVIQVLVVLLLLANCNENGPSQDASLKEKPNPIELSRSPENQTDPRPAPKAKDILLDQKLPALLSSGSLAYLKFEKQIGGLMASFEEGPQVTKNHLGTKIPVNQKQHDSHQLHLDDFSQIAISGKLTQVLRSETSSCSDTELGGSCSPNVVLEDVLVLNTHPSELGSLEEIQTDKIYELLQDQKKAYLLHNESNVYSFASATIHELKVNEENEVLSIEIASQTYEFEKGDTGNWVQSIENASPTKLMLKNIGPAEKKHLILSIIETGSEKHLLDVLLVDPSFFNAFTKDPLITL